jgi:molybdopterin molybdotransferase
MITPAEAWAAIEAVIQPVRSSETVPLEAATGRILAEPVLTERDLPPFDRVAMDGIAIREADWAHGHRHFVVDGIVGAGSEPPAVTAEGHCLEVMTGAMLPPGTDTVIPVETIRLSNGSAEILLKSLTMGANVHRRATDGLAGEVALHPGMRLRGPEIAVAASVGRKTLLVRRRAGIAVISTGDELVGPDDPVLPWQIRRSNAQGIVSMLQSRGQSDVIDAHIGDQREQLLERIGNLLASRDVLILSGGVSAGRFDHVPGVLRELGVTQIFHKIAQRPGKPLWFGVGPKGQAVFALPGNPVSTLVCLTRYVLPALECLAGLPPPPPVAVELESAWTSAGSLTAFIPVVRVAPGSRVVRIHQTRGSGDFISLVGTDGFIELAAGKPQHPGSAVPFYTW